jgi:hypothetical protein
VPGGYIRNPKQGATSTTYDLVVADHTAEGAVTVHNDGSFKDLVKIAFNKVDAWLEEDEEIQNHPRDPYKVRTLTSHSVAKRDVVVQRIDIRQSSRHVRVEIDGAEVANTTKPCFLYETGLPVRTYIPKGDVRLDLLTHSKLTTDCPYKVRSLYSPHNLNVMPTRLI